MNEKIISPEKETLEKKIERFMPIFQKSLDIFLDTEKDPRIAELSISRRLPDGKIEKIDGLVVFEITEDGPNLGYIDDNGEPGDSATILWPEIESVSEK